MACNPNDQCPLAGPQIAHKGPQRMTGIFRFGVALVLLLIAGLALPEPAAAASDDTASEITLPEQLSKPEVRDLISRL